MTLDGHPIRFSNLDKVLYPETGTTKAEVISYFMDVAPVLLPHLRQRPVTRKRWPDGVGTHDQPGSAFFAKNLPKGTPDWVRRYPFQHHEHHNDYPVADDVATLAWLGQLAVLELHVPQWRFDDAGQPLPPDRLVLDLDPGEGVSLAECAQVARWARDLLVGVGLVPVPVTSGSKGIHLYAGLDGSHSSQEATELARQLALALQAEHPDQVTAVMARAGRPGKVFIDWSQNNGAKTTVSPYSLRGRARPTIAAPRTWVELDAPDLRHLEFDEVLERIARDGDLLAPVLPHQGTDRLATYRSMRDASRTPEPVPSSGAGSESGSGRSFVIQEHHARRLHYDVRLERDGVLVSWAVPKGPPTDPAVNHLAVQTEDHPLEYGSFEGTIPAGEYGGGEVRIWDAGSYDLEKWRDGKEIIATLHGRPGGGLGGSATFALIHTGGRDTDARNWLMHRMRRPEVRPLPEPVEPMLATLARPEDIVDEAEWAFEMKWDGIRVIAAVADGRVRLLSRAGREETERYPELVAELSRLGCREAVLDGEIVVLDPSGTPSFGLLQPRINLTRAADIMAAVRQAPAHLMLFDLLGLDGESLVRRPYQERRAALERLVPVRLGARIQVPPVFDGDLAAALDASAGFRLEGVVAKRLGSVYQPGRRAHTWLKIKHRRTQAVVVGGWRPGQGHRSHGIGSLLLGIPGADSIAYVGRVGSGFTDAGLAEAERMLAPLARETSSLAGVPVEDAHDAHWVEPVLVGEVFYGERTASGRLRHPVWRGWRPDTPVERVTWE